MRTGPRSFLATTLGYAWGFMALYDLCNGLPLKAILDYMISLACARISDEA